MSDFLRECFESVRPQLSQIEGGDKISVDQFKAQVCSTCCAPDCDLSRLSSSSFQDRVTNWKERLFLNPVRLDPKDPRFPVFNSKSFLEVPIVGRGSAKQVAVSDWLDPLQKTEVKEATPPRKLSPEAPVVSDPPKKVPSVSSDAGASQEQLQLPSNTPFQQGSTLPGAPEKTPEPPPEADVWGGPLPPPPLSTDENPAIVLKPGGKFRFGS